MLRRLSALPGALLTLGVLAALWLPLLDLHGRALWALSQKPGDFRDVWTTFVPHLWERSLLLALVTCAFAAILGVPCGWLFSRGPRMLRIPARVLAAVPLGLPPVISAAPFFSLAGPNRNPLWLCAGVLALSFFPVVAFGVAAAIENLAPEEEEAALGFASPWKAWSGVLLSRIAPTLGGSLVVVAALCLWEMGAPALLSYSTLSSEVYRQLDSGGVDAALPDLRAALAGLPLPLVALLFLAPLNRLKWTANGFNRGEGFARLPLLWLGGVAVLMAMPLGLLARFVWALDGWPAFANVLEGNDDAVVNTLGLSTVASFGSTLGALVLCWIWRDWSRRARSFVWSAGVLPGAFAPVVIGVALSEWFNRDVFAGLYDSTYGMALWGNFARFFPVALALLFPAVLALDPESLWAARGLGASSLRALWTVALPLLRPVLAGTFALLWALCAGELSVAVLVHGPGSDTLPIPIFNLLHTGIAADVAALCLVLALLCGGAMGAASWFLRKR